MSRINQSTTLPQGPEVKKIFCAYHPNQFLTNFCCDEQCLMPLCPNCIVEHTEQHFLENNKPLYVNLLDALAETKQKCYQNIILFEQLSKHNDKIYDYAVGLRQSIHNQLCEDKQEIFRQIDFLFEEYEEKLMAQTLQHYKQLQVYDRKQTGNISQFINQQIEIIHEQINVLKGDNCLAGLINFYKNDGKIYEDSIKEIAEYINRHRKAGKISINSDQQKLSQTLEGFCQHNLSIQFINQDQRQEEQRMKNSNVSKEGNKSLAQKLSQKQLNGHHEYAKENQQGHSNLEYRNMIRKSDDYYKIDAQDLRSSKPTVQSLPSYYQRQNSRSRF